MPGLCRVGDCLVGHCEANAPGHPRDCVGVWTTGSSSVQSEGIGVVRVGDFGVTNCGHTFQAVEGSSNVTAEGMGIVRVGDVAIIIEGGVGVSVTGSGLTSN